MSNRVLEGQLRPNPPFGTVSDYTAGLATIYEEFGTSGAVLLEKDYTWEQTSAGSPFVGTLVSRLNPGATYAAQTSTVQVQDNYGNLTQSQVTDYANSTTGTRTYNFTYAYNEPGWRADYAALYIFNRMTSATVTPSGDRSVGTVGHDYADQRYYSGNTGRFWNPEILRLGDGEVLDGGPRRD
jgi:hypothetical protein